METKRDSKIKIIQKPIEDASQKRELSNNNIKKNMRRVLKPEIRERGKEEKAELQ